MAIDLSTLVVKVRGDSSRLSGDLGKATKTFRAYSANIAKIGAATAAAMSVVVIKNLNEIDKIAKVSSTIGIATDRLVGLGHAAKLSGADQETLNKALLKMNVRLSEYRIGLASSARGFEQLGISYDDLKNKTPDQQFALIADKLNMIASESERNRIAFDIFGKSGQSLLNTLNLGSEGLEAMYQEALALGIAFDNIDAKKVEDANDAITRATAIFKGAQIQLTVGLAPMIELVADAFTVAAKKSDAFASSAKTSTEIITTIAVLAADALQGWQVIIKSGEVLILKSTTSIAKMLKSVSKNFDLLAIKIVRSVNDVIASLPGLNIDFVNFKPTAYSQDEITIRQEALAIAQSELDVLLNQGKASERILASLTEANKLRLSTPDVDTTPVIEPNVLELGASSVTDYSASIDQAYESTQRMDEASRALGDIGFNAIDSALRGNMDSWQDWASFALNALNQVISASTGNSVGGIGGLLGGLIGALGGGGSALGGTILPATGGAMSIPLGVAAADGGTLRAGTLNMVGERGAELFIPKSDGMVVPNHLLNEIGGGGSSTVINQSFSGGVTRTDLQRFGAKIYEETVRGISASMTQGGKFSQLTRLA